MHQHHVGAKVEKQRASIGQAQKNKPSNSVRAKRTDTSKNLARKTSVQSVRINEEERTSIEILKKCLNADRKLNN